MVLGMVSEIELSFIKQRQSEGIAAAKARGVYQGRPRSVDNNAILQLQALGVTAIAANTTSPKSWLTLWFPIPVQSESVCALSMEV